MARTTPKTLTTIELSNFLGVDFASEETEVDVRRSPLCKNIVSSLSGRPEKRPGYRTVYDYSNVGPIYGLFNVGDAIIIHAGNKLFSTAVDDGETAIYSNLGQQRSATASLNGRTFFLEGFNYLELTETTATPVTGYTPTTVIGREPTGGGTPFEDVNLISPTRKNSFTTDGSATVFQLDATALDSVDSVSVGGVLKTVETDYTVDLANGTVTFVEAPPDDNGVDSVVITFSKTVSGYADRIKKCRIMATYGVGNDSRLFVAGNPNYPNTDWQSGLYDPTYFPDRGYTQIGSDDTAIMGYLKQYDSMLIIKEQEENRTTIFSRTAQLTEDGTAIFPVKESLAGIGAISPYSFTTANGDALFLSRNGVYGFDTNAITSQRSVQLRSWYVNPRLMQEVDLDKAVATVWGNLMLLAVGDHCYVADLHQKNQNQGGSYGYEWYYWTNIPATLFLERDGALYFGTQDGKVCRFYNAILDASQDGTPVNSFYADDGQAIDAYWFTPLLDGGNFMRKKNISKKGTGILAKPYTRSSGEIYFTTNKSFQTLIRAYNIDIFDFNDVDFNRFTFNTRDNPKVIVAPKKQRKIYQFQMGVRNNAPREGFGVLAMMISYTVGGFTRRDV